MLLNLKMAPFIRVRAMKFHHAKVSTTNSNNVDDYYVAINIKECVVENGMLHTFIITIFAIYAIFYF